MKPSTLAQSAGCSLVIALAAASAGAAALSPVSGSDLPPTITADASDLASGWNGFEQFDRIAPPAIRLIDPRRRGFAHGDFPDLPGHVSPQPLPGFGIEGEPLPEAQGAPETPQWRPDLLYPLSPLTDPLPATPGFGLPPGSPVPAPGAVLLLTLGAAAGSTRRRR